LSVEQVELLLDHSSPGLRDAQQYLELVFEEEADEPLRIDDTAGASDADDHGPTR
jgi:hypothetical protein